jgi:molybdopterin-guanine dinucleotide biosynthesis protein MobB
MAVLRVVGPPGSGKTLLIVSLTEALRSRGYRIATAVERTQIDLPALDEEISRDLAAGAVSTVVVLSGGGRVTLEHQLPLNNLRSVVASMDPSVDLLIAEGFPDDDYPAVEISPPGSPALMTSADRLLAVVSSEDIQGAFAQFGPGETQGIADLVEERLLADTQVEDVSMQLSVEGEPVDGTGFVTDMIARPVLTMVEQLKGIDWPRAVRLNIRRRRPPD